MSARITEALDHIAQQGWAVIPDFLDAQTVADLLKEQKNLVKHGVFKQAGIGKGQHFQLRPEIRSDQLFHCRKSIGRPLTNYDYALIESFIWACVPMNAILRFIRPDRFTKNT